MSRSISIAIFFRAASSPSDLIAARYAVNKVGFVALDERLADELGGHGVLRRRDGPQAEKHSGQQAHGVPLRVLA